MFDTIFWAVIGTLSGVIFGVIPGAGPFVATATLYPFLTHIEPVNVMMYYVTVLIATNYTNSVTAILYGIPGDASAMMTARTTRCGLTCFSEQLEHERAYMNI